MKDRVFHIDIASEAGAGVRAQAQRHTSPPRRDAESNVADMKPPYAATDVRAVVTQTQRNAAAPPCVSLRRLTPGPARMKRNIRARKRSRYARQAQRRRVRCAEARRASARDAHAHEEREHHTDESRSITSE